MRIKSYIIRTFLKHFRLIILVMLILICIIGSILTVQFINIHSNTTDLRKPEKQPTRTAMPTATPTITNVPPPSGQPMPVGDIPGWKQVFAEDFNTNVPIGSFPGSVYRSKLTVYGDGAKDTAGKQKGAPSRYYPSRVANVSGGLLNLHLHTENGIPMAAAILPVLPSDQLYGKYTIRFRSDELPGFKIASLLWPDSEKWPRDGEIDFPETYFEGKISAYVHHQNGKWASDQDAYDTMITDTATSWHTASIEWSPEKVSFIFDDQSIGTSTTRIPDTAMHWVIQTESCLHGCPDATTAGNLQIDWIVAYSLA